MIKIKPLFFLNKKIITIFFMVCLVFSLSFFSSNVKAQTVLYYYNHTPDTVNIKISNETDFTQFGELLSSSHSTPSLPNNEYLYRMTLPLQVMNFSNIGSPTGYFYAFCYQINNALNTTTLVDYSYDYSLQNINWVKTGVGTDLNFGNLVINFVNHVYLNSSNNYLIGLSFDLNYSVSPDTYLVIGSYSSGSGGSYYYDYGAFGNTWQEYTSYQIIGTILTESVINVNPNNVVNMYFLNDGLGNVVFSEFNGNSQSSLTIASENVQYSFNNATELNITAMANNGYYFSNFSIVSSFGSFYNMTSFINPLIILVSDTIPPNNTGFNNAYIFGEEINITAHFSSTENTKLITLNNGDFGQSYWQNIDSNNEPAGSLHYAGTYNMGYGSIFYINCIPNSGYSFSQWNITNIDSNTSFIVPYQSFLYTAVNNMIITPSYVVGNGNGNGNGNGLSGILPILTSIFGNVKTDIIFIIFGIVCALLTWKFAMTGLIAGIGISVFLCVMAGLLDIWAVGLCIVLDITLIVLGSGLLNKNESKPVG